MEAIFDFLLGCLKLFFENISGISTLLGIIFVFYTLDAFRREHRWKKDVDLAEDALALFYEAKDTIQYIRSPFSFESETEDITQFPGESSREYTARKRASVVRVRYSKKSELFNKIHAIRYRFMSQIGKEKARPFEQLHRVNNTIMGASDALAHLWAQEVEALPVRHREETWRQHVEQEREYEAIFWSMARPGQPDTIAEEVSQIISDLENICAPIIASKGTLFNWFNRKVGSNDSRFQPTEQNS